MCKSHRLQSPPTKPFPPLVRCAALPPPILSSRSLLTVAVEGWVIGSAVSSTASVVAGASRRWAAAASAVCVVVSASVLVQGGDGVAVAVSNIRIAAVVLARVVSSALFTYSKKGKKPLSILITTTTTTTTTTTRSLSYPKDHWTYHAAVVVAAVSVRCADVIAVAGLARAPVLRAVSLARSRNWRRRCAVCVLVVAAIACNHASQPATKQDSVRFLTRTSTVWHLL